MWLCVKKYLIFTESIFELKYANIVTVNFNKSLSLFTFISVSILRIDLVITFIRIKEKSNKDLLKFTVTIFAYLSSKILSVKIKYFLTQSHTQPEDFYENVRVNKNILTPNILTQSDCW